MTVMFYDAFEGNQSEVASKTGTLHATGNFIRISAEYGGTATNRGNAV